MLRGPSRLSGGGYTALSLNVVGLAEAVRASGRRRCWRHTVVRAGAPDTPPGGSDWPALGCSPLHLVCGSARGISTGVTRFGAVGNPRSINEMRRIDGPSARAWTPPRFLSVETGCSKLPTALVATTQLPPEPPEARMANSRKAQQLGTSTNSCAEP